jgi:hypothetical protein
LALELPHAAAALPIAAENATAAAHSTCPECPVPDTFCAATTDAATLQLPPPPHGTSRRRRPVSQASPGPLRYTPCPSPPLCFPSPRSLRERRCRRPKFAPRIPLPRHALRHHHFHPVPPALPAPRYERCRRRRFASPFPHRLRECRRRPWFVPRVRSSLPPPS